MTEEELVSRFRPNLVVSGNGIEPYSEDQWNDVIIGDQKFQVSVPSLATGPLRVGTNDALYRWWGSAADVELCVLTRELASSLASHSRHSWSCEAVG